jgi:hypothetical protein
MAWPKKGNAIDRAADKATGAAQSGGSPGWSDKAREAAAASRQAHAATVSPAIQKTRDKATKAGMSHDQYSQSLGYKSHQEHMDLTAPRKGADKGRYRPKTMGEW